MKVNKFSRMYLVGMICILLSVFFPYFRYRFTIQDVETLKQGYPLLNLKKLATQYSGMGEINFFTRVVPYFILLAGIAGIVLILIYFAGDHDTWNIFNLNMFIPVVASGVGLFIIRHHQTIRAIREILNDTTESMRESGYTGSAGYGAGFYLLAAGVMISLVSAVCFFALDK
jgi:hypothetical protein